MNAPAAPPPKDPTLGSDLKFITDAFLNSVYTSLLSLKPLSDRIVGVDPETILTIKIRGSISAPVLLIYVHANTALTKGDGFMFVSSYIKPFLPNRPYIVMKPPKPVSVMTPLDAAKYIWNSLPNTN